MTLLDFAKEYVRVYCKDTKKVIYETPDFKETEPDAHLFLHNLLVNLTEPYWTIDYPTVEAGLEVEEEDFVGDIIKAAYLTSKNTTYDSCPKKYQVDKARTYEVQIGPDYKTERITDIDLR